MPFDVHARFRSIKPLTALGAAVALAAASMLGAPLAAHAAGGPTFVQQAAAHHGSAATLAVTPAAAVTAGDRLVVEVGTWSSGSATASTVTDSAGNGYTELSHFTASDHTELSVWSAPITAGGGTKPTITVKASSAADIGITVLEYSGLSTAGDASVVDVSAHATGTTSAAGTVASGTTAATTASGELTLGFYADSGFGDTVTAGAGFASRADVSPTSDIEVAAEDQTAALGATPSATFGTGAKTVWLAAALVLRSGASSTPTAPDAPSAVAATAGNASAQLSWAAPADGGSPITSYTITPYAAGVAQTPTTLTGTPPATSTTVSGLTNGTTYTFTVAAANAIGEGQSSAASNAVTPGPDPQGQFGALQTWPIVAVHSVVLDDGRVLQWDGWQTPEPTEIYDPKTGTFTEVTAPSSIFCSGATKLPDGRVLVVGGYGVQVTGNLGIVDTNIFDPSTNTWTKVANMHEARWYPDLVELPDGRYIAISGNSSSANTWADNPEIYDPVANTWTLLSNINTSQVHEEEYPFSYLAPNGKVFTIGPSEDVSYWLDPNAQTWTPIGSSGVVNGSSVMYRPGQILYSGGSASVINTTPAQSNAAVINLNAANPSWQAIAPMNYARVYHTLTMLADGRVLAIGGEQTSDQTDYNTGVLPAEIWDPATGQWTTIGSIAAARNYHSTAVLEPDGTVLIAGGGHDETNGAGGQFSAQVYSPSYLFNGARPTIASAPATAVYGSTMTISTPDAASIGSVNLVSYAADTHQADMDQHFVPLSFTTGNGTLSVQAPANGAYAPPGDYMLFIVNKAGTPSVAATVHIAAAPPTTPSAPTNVTAVAGTGSASVSWTAPSDGGSQITSYTVTPYLGGVAQTATTVTGNPPATTTTVPNLTDGDSYTFTVTADNAVGSSPASAASNAVTPTSTITPAFVQQASVHHGGSATASIAMGSPVVLGDRLVVEVGVWDTASDTARSVTDSAGNVYTELTHFTAADHTELSVWSAPITAGGGTRPTVTVTATGSADIGATAQEYSGLSSAAGTGVVDVQAHAVGRTSSAATVASGATTATSAAGELALGFYADSGFGDALGAGTGFTVRTDVSPTSDIEFLAEDQIAAQGTAATATFATGASTTWLAAVLVLKHA